MDDDDQAWAWINGRSPAPDCGPSSCSEDNFHELIDSVLGGGSENERGGMHQDPSSRGSFSSSCTPEEEQLSGENLRGLRLVHLLVAAAEALAGDRRDLARVILLRLEELASPGAVANIERLAAYLTDGLQGLLMSQPACEGSLHQHPRPKEEELAAIQLLHDATPYAMFGHFTANQAILEAAAGARRLHIVDYDVMDGAQWASLMQALVSREVGAPPPPPLRITAVTPSDHNSNRSQARRIQETGRRLAELAASLGVQFSFGLCRLNSNKTFRPSAVKLLKGEDLVVNCMLHMPHSPPGSVSSFLCGVQALKPKLITLAEEESRTAAAGAGKAGWVEEFVDTMHYYSAVLDSLEDGFPMRGRERVAVERVVVAPRITAAVAQPRMGGGERGCGIWMAKMGFRGMGISFFNQCQARLLLGLFDDGYRVECEGNQLVLCWKARRLISVSVWSLPSFEQ